VRNSLVIFRRELSGYFATPVAYVFAVVFLILAGFFTFKVGGLYEREQADLQPFFSFLPWLFLFLIPAISMRLWSEERKSGTIELLMTLPVSMTQAVVGKFLAAWFYAGLVLVLTFPIWATVNYLGDPDNGVIVAGYVGTFLLAGAFLSIGTFCSAITRNQVVAFVLTGILCLGFVLVGYFQLVEGIDRVLPRFVIETLTSFGILNHFNSISRGVIDLRDLIFFLSLILCFLISSAIVIDWKKAE
jgi:ABC-2 type transport system permease protein